MPKKRYLVIVAVILSVALVSCDSPSQEGIEPLPQDEVTQLNPPMIYQILDLWEEATVGNEEARIRSMTVSWGEEMLSFEGSNNQTWSSPGDLEIRFRGWASKETGQVKTLSVHGLPVGSPFKPEKLELFRSSCHILFSIADPTLSDEDIADMMDELLLSPGLEDELEAFPLSVDNRLETTRNGIHYRVNRFGSEEGGTFELVAEFPD